MRFSTIISIATALLVAAPALAQENLDSSDWRTEKLLSRELAARDAE